MTKLTKYYKKLCNITAFASSLPFPPSLWEEKGGQAETHPKTTEVNNCVTPLISNLDVQIFTTPICAHKAKAHYFKSKVHALDRNSTIDTNVSQEQGHNRFLNQQMLLSSKASSNGETSLTTCTFTSGTVKYHYGLKHTSIFPKSVLRMFKMVQHDIKGTNVLVSRYGVSVCSSTSLLCSEGCTKLPSEQSSNVNAFSSKLSSTRTRGTPQGLHSLNKMQYADLVCALIKASNYSDLIHVGAFITIANHSQGIFISACEIKQRLKLNSNEDLYKAFIKQTDLILHAVLRSQRTTHRWVQMCIQLRNKKLDK